MTQWEIWLPLAEEDWQNDSKGGCFPAGYTGPEKEDCVVEYTILTSNPAEALAVYHEIRNGEHRSLYPDSANPFRPAKGPNPWLLLEQALESLLVLSRHAEEAEKQGIPKNDAVKEASASFAKLSRQFFWTQEDE